MTAEARKHQIVQIALEMIGRYGVQGATISRIAKGAGITTAALYTHFENRHAILLAALDAVYEKIFETHHSSSTSNVIERLREICDYHAHLIGTQNETGHAHLFLELVAASPEDELREALREKQLAAVEDMAQIVSEGKERGEIASHVDPHRVAWLIAGWAWTGDVAHLMGVGSIWHPPISSELLDLILTNIAARPGASAHPATTTVVAVEE